MMAVVTLQSIAIASNATVQYDEELRLSSVFLRFFGERRWLNTDEELIVYNQRALKIDDGLLKEPLHQNHLENTCDKTTKQTNR